MVLGILVDDGHDPLPQLLHDLALRLFGLCLGVLGVPIERLGLLVDVAYELLFLLGAHGVGALTELGLVGIQVRLLLRQLGAGRFDIGLQIGNCFLPISGAENRILDVNNADLRASRWAALRVSSHRSEKEGWNGNYCVFQAIKLLMSFDTNILKTYGRW